MFRNLAIFAFTSSIALSGAVIAQAQPAAPAAAPPDAAAAAAQTFSINQNVGDWVVRCVQTTVKSPAPCEVMQTTINNQSKQRISSFSIAYVPSRDAYAMQIVVPTGVALAKGLALGASLNGAKFNRCERDGCYVELLIDNAAVTSLQNSGKSTQIKVTSYGPQGKEIPLPVSLTGFPEAMDRMKTLAKERAVALPASATNPLVSGPAPAAAPPAAAPAAAAPAAGRPAAGRGAAPAKPAAPTPGR